MISSLYIYKKEIDWSALNFGLNIPISLQMAFYEALSLRLRRGESQAIKLLLEGVAYPAMLSNLGFDSKKYPARKDIVHIWYTPTSPIAKKLREIFASSFSYLQVEKGRLTNKKKQLVVPADRREYMALYTTPFDDVLAIECITHEEIIEVKETLQGFGEVAVEQLLQAADIPALIEQQKIVKVRKLDRSIGESLKALYQHRCQICGQSVGKRYDATVVHTHHIEYFSVSLNNNANNIMVVCPNHHGIIHAAMPCFDRTKKVFTYSNGYVEGLKLNLHL